MVNGWKIRKMDQKWVKTDFSWIYWKDLSLIFTDFVLFGMFLHKSDIWANLSLWNMGQNVLRQSFWKNVPLTMSPEQIYETGWDD